MPIRTRHIATLIALSLAGIALGRMRNHQRKTRGRRQRRHSGLGRRPARRCPAPARHGEVRRVHEGARAKAPDAGIGTRRGDQIRTRLRREPSTRSHCEIKLLSARGQSAVVARHRGYIWRWPLQQRAAYSPADGEVVDTKSEAEQAKNPGDRRHRALSAATSSNTSCAAASGPLSSRDRRGTPQASSGFAAIMTEPDTLKFPAVTTLYCTADAVLLANTLAPAASIRR